MNKFILILFITFCTISQSYSQKENNTPNINGTNMIYEYDNGGKVKGEFKDDSYYFEWTDGPYKGIKGKVNYKIIKVSRKRFVISFLVKEHASLVTLYIDFKKKKLYGSAFIEKKEKYFQSLEEAKITDLNFKEHKK